MIKILFKYSWNASKTDIRPPRKTDTFCKIKVTGNVVSYHNAIKLEMYHKRLSKILPN